MTNIPGDPGQSVTPLPTTQPAGQPWVARPPFSRRLYIVLFNTTRSRSLEGLGLQADNIASFLAWLAGTVKPQFRCEDCF